MTDPQTARNLIEAFKPRTIRSDLERTLELAAAAPDMVPCPDCGSMMTVGGKCSNCGFEMADPALTGKEYSALTMEQRKNLPKSDFAIPEKAPGPGSYPIGDLAHARIALSLASGKPEEGRVKAAVYRKYPQLKPDNDADD